VPLVAPLLGSPAGSADSLLVGLVLSVNGYAVGAGEPLRITDLSGLDDLPAIHTFDSERPGVDGLDFGVDLRGGRIIEVNLVGKPTDPTGTLQALRSALVDGDSTLVVTGLPGLPDLQLAGRIRRRKINTDRDMANRVIRCAFDFECADPRLYDAVETVLTTGPGTASGTGLTPPLTPPLTPGGSAVGGNVTAVNNGIRTTLPRVRVDGPVTAFSLLNATTSRKLTYLQALAAGEYVDIDFDARTVLLNGTANRRAYTFGAWWDLPPGSSSVFYLPADAAVGSLMTLRFRSAY
jgi:hypothetical protein